jgi:MATE family multidrug resistance protein
VVLRLALPVIIAELGWMFMGVVDTIMVGPLGPSAIGAVSIGGILFDVFGIFGIGLLLGLDTLVSQAYGAGRLKECDLALWHGLYVTAAATPCLIFIMFGIPTLMRVSGVHGGVLALAVPYLHTMIWSLPPLMVYAAFRRYLQGMGRVRIVMFALLSANAVNAVGNWLLIPSYGVEGAGWATCGARVYMMSVLVMFAIAHDPELVRHIPGIDLSRIKALLKLGVPAALQILLEVGVFAAATVLAGKLVPEALAAHHIVLNIAGTTFMIPLGVSSAGAVSVGQAIGRADKPGARRAGWIALALGAGFMFTAALLFVTVPEAILGVFTRNTDVLAIAVPLLFVAAVFQIFDGVQVVTTGVLRGAGNTQTPMLANLLGHWLLGLPAGYVLCFIAGLGVVGLWMGLSLGLITVGIFLLTVWYRMSL